MFGHYMYLFVENMYHFNRNICVNHQFEINMAPRTPRKLSEILDIYSED